MYRVKVVYPERLATQVNLENEENLAILVNQENLAFQENLVKMVLMEEKIIVLSALESMQTKENLVIQDNQENVENLDLEDPLDILVIMPSAILENRVKMVNLEGLDNLEKMVHLENLAIMVVLEMKMI